MSGLLAARAGAGVEERSKTANQGPEDGRGRPICAGPDIEVAVNRCLFCGDEPLLDVVEVYPETREFEIETCCAGSYEMWVEDMRDWDRRTWSSFFRELAGVEVRRVVEDLSWSGSMLLDFGLRLGDVSLAEAKEFVREHHRHNRPPCGWRWGHGAFNGRELVAVAMVGRPVARRLDYRTIVEVNRLCVSTEIPAGIAWNACSLLYGAAAREAKRRGFERIITYTLEDEPATALRAVEWTAAATIRGGSWNRPSRAREDTAPTGRKIRWEKELQPTRPARTLTGHRPGSERPATNRTVSDRVEVRSLRAYTSFTQQRR